MNPSDKEKSLRTYWYQVNDKLLLGVLLLVFLAYTTFIATNLLRDIVPDEPYHLSQSQDFRASWGIPEISRVARSHGVYVRQNPYFAYWIFGRALALLDLIKPQASPWQELVYLRLVNILFSIGTVFFTYLLAREITKNKWWPLLAVFLLTHTMMFTLLSSGVSYDNPANFFSIAGIYFLYRVLNGKDFLINSLGWMIFMGLGTLTKLTLLPLALPMAILWIVFIVRERPGIAFRQLSQLKQISLVIVLGVVLIANIGLYGVNLVKFQSLTPSCSDYYSKEFCAQTGFSQRRESLALPEKPNVFQAFRQGYPEPLRYFFDTWVRWMLNKIFGVMGGQKSYYPIGIAYYHILLYWAAALGFRYFRGTSRKIYSLIGIFGFYALTLFIQHYDIELAYGFIQVALQGRHIFPVIGIAYALAANGLMKVPNKWLQYGTLVAAILLFLYGGPLRFILYNQSVFAEWFR